MNKELFKSEIKNELDSILGFWIESAIDKENGGFVGRLDNDNVVDVHSPKSSILNARILFTFSLAYNLTKKQEYLLIAARSYNYIKDFFVDNEFGGVYWMLDSKGIPVDSKKQIYVLGFAIYGLTEYYKASKDQQALNLAKEIYKNVEQYSFDKDKNGYFEAFTRDWKVLEDLRLSEKDQNEAKTMNTHLHIMEAYTTLYSVWQDENLKKQLKNLLDIHLYKILDSNTWHFNLFFDEDWNLKSDKISYGHDIEGAWLMEEAAKALNDKELINVTRQNTLKIADVTINEGIMQDGSVMNEGNHKGEFTDTNKEWWTHAETMVGLVRAWKHSGDEKYLEVAFRVWTFIKTYLKAPNGEWYWGVHADMSLNVNDKIGQWKCPYHNGRACVEILKMIGS